MKFSNQLEATMVLDWRPHYIDYKALKKKLKQARAEAGDAVDALAALPQTTSLSIARSFATCSPGGTSVMLQQQHFQQGQAAAAQIPLENSDKQQLSQQLQQTEQPVFFTAYGLAPSGTAQEQFLQMLQQDLAKVRGFILSRAAALSAALESLAAAAPQLAAHDTHTLEHKAQSLGQQLLALEKFVHVNQTGFVKIVKKHDKLLPESPIWHLYLHHLQRTPWLEESQRQFMWAALSSCYYHLHASFIAVGNSSRRRQRSRAEQKQLDTAQTSNSTAASVAGTGSSTAAVKSAVSSSSSGLSRGVSGSFLPGVAAAVAGAATAVGAAATAVAGAASAARAAVSSVRTPDASAVKQVHAEVPSAPGVHFTRKFWVAQEDISAVMYTILQHMPLLPCSSHSSTSKQQQQQPGFGTRPSAANNKRLQRQQPLPPPQQQRLQEFAGYTTALHSVYFDNRGLELYHGRLYFRPSTQTLKARWISHDDDSSWAPEKVVLERKIYNEGWQGARNITDSLLIAGDILPSYLVGTFTLGDALSQLHELPALQHKLQHTLSDLQQRHKRQSQLQHMSPFAAAVATARAAGGWPGADSSAGAAAAAAADAEVNAALAAAGVHVPQGVVLGANLSFKSSSGVGSSANVEDECGYVARGASATTGGEAVCQIDLTKAQQHEPLPEREKQHQQHQQHAAYQQQQHETRQMGLQHQQVLQPISAPDVSGSHLQRSHLPSTALHRRTRSSVSAATTTSSFPDSSDTNSDDDYDDHISQQQQQDTGAAAVESDNASTVATSGGCSGSNGSRATGHTVAFEAAYEDAYLDPPVPTTDQLSLFTEVQKLVASKRLQPVLHCTLQRMLFAMPFDDRIKITLDTDVSITAVAHHQLLKEPTAGQQQPTAASSRQSVSDGAVLPPSSSWQQTQRLQQQDQSHQEQTLAATGSNISAVAGSSSHAHQSFIDAAAMACGEGSPLYNSTLGYHARQGATAQDAEAYRTWDAIFSAIGNHIGSRHHSSTGGCSSKSVHVPDLTYGMPYSLLKINVNLPPGQNMPLWLLQLMESELVTPVEDWSKFVHGCAVLLPDAVRAVPYWIDDPLIDLSVQAIQNEIEAVISRRELQLQRALKAAAAVNAVQRSASHCSISSAASGDVHPVARRSPGHSHGGSGNILTRLAVGVNSLLPGTVHSGNFGLPRSSSASSTQPPGSPTVAAHSQHPSGGGAHSEQEQYRHCTGQSSSSRHSIPTQYDAAAAAAGSSLKLDHCLKHSVGGGSSGTAEHDSVPIVSGSPRRLQTGRRHLIRQLSSLVRRQQQQQPLFRPEGSIQGGWRKRWGHPVQLLECREFFNSEAIFLDWLRIAITMASVAVLLLGYSAMAYVNPLKRPVLHLAEIISLCLLPTSCLMVAYAMRVYIWRGKRLHSMRYKRVDDQVGPIIMTAVFVTAMVAIFLVNVADLLLMLKHKAKQQGGDDAGGDADPGSIAWIVEQVEYPTL